MTYTRKNSITGKRSRPPKWKQRADRRRRKWGIYKVNFQTRKNMSRAQRKRRRKSDLDLFGILFGKKSKKTRRNKWL